MQFHERTLALQYSHGSKRERPLGRHHSLHAHDLLAPAHRVLVATGDPDLQFSVIHNYRTERLRHGADFRAKRRDAILRG